MVTVRVQVPEWSKEPSLCACRVKKKNNVIAVHCYSKACCTTVPQTPTFSAVKPIISDDPLKSITTTGALHRTASCPLEKVFYSKTGARYNTRRI